LKGLEVSVLSLSSAFDHVENPTIRIDSSYFMKEFLSLSRYSNSIGNIALVRSGTTPTDRDDDLADGVVLLKTIDIQNRPLSTADSDLFYRISPEVAKRMEKTRLEPKDVLINIVGATTDVIGRVALVPPDFPEANITQAMALIRTAGLLCVPEVLFVFLAGKFGQSQVRRLARPTGQYNLNLPEIESITIPTFSARFSDRIRLCVEAASGVREQSKQQLQQAERTLLHTLGLDTWAPPEALSYVRSSSDAFAAGRLDSQFFAPRVEQLLARLGRDGLTIADVAPARHERFEPTATGDFDYIEIGSLGADGTAVAEAVPMAEAPSRATQYVRSGDVITSTVRPIRRLSALINPDQDGAVCSSGFVVLEPRGVSSEVLLTYLRLPVVCELMDLHTSATMYPAISEADLLSLPIPAIAPPVQQQIQADVRQAGQARQRATQLLDAAKRAVEIAIEDSEAAALTYLKGLM
jgi:type I restriction enzyme S subunit